MKPERTFEMSAKELFEAFLLEVKSGQMSILQIEEGSMIRREILEREKTEKDLVVGFIADEFDRISKVGSTDFESSTRLFVILTRLADEIDRDEGKKLAAENFSSFFCSSRKEVACPAEELVSTRPLRTPLLYFGIDGVFI